MILAATLFILVLAVCIGLTVWAANRRYFSFGNVVIFATAITVLALIMWALMEL